MGVEGLVSGEGQSYEERKEALADKVKESADRVEAQKKEKDKARKERQIRLGHIEKPKAKAKPKEEPKEETTS